ncbi:hypothetical protein BH23ACT11_BH23ACT11_26720 [soil metagenome]
MSNSGEATFGRKNYPTPETLNMDKERVELLAREEFSRKSLSYVVSGILVALFGFFMIVPFSSAVIPLSEDARSNGFVLDLLFLAIVSILSVNSLSRSYMFLHRDPFHGWLLFQRSLPVSPKQIVLARSFVMLSATVVMSALFFGPLFILSWALEYKFDAGQYLSFVLIWLGYALFSGGLNLFMELGLNGKIVAALQIFWMGLIVAIVWLLNGDLVFTTFKLAGSHGPLPAGISLLAGGLLFALLAKATEHRVGNREMSQ